MQYIDIQKYAIYNNIYILLYVYYTYIHIIYVYNKIYILCINILIQKI